MAEHKAGGGGGGSDIWWFLGIMAIFFFLWVSGGGPERAEKAGLGDVKIQTGAQNSNPTPSSTNENAPTYVDGQIIY